MTLTLTARPDRTQQWTFDLPPPNTPGTGGWRNAPGATEWRSLPQWFKSQGYYTAGTGKLFHPGDPAFFDPLFELVRLSGCGM